MLEAGSREETDKGVVQTLETMQESTLSPAPLLLEEEQVQVGEYTSRY